ncbi:hypothetical protein HU200_019822 [Digitaria exilis]|uniref:Alkyl transferase n=1 Tax=Digitaria exilis TaxID=1010633 RepID=A0A835F2N6_9POAL|nr:hypothetical protein HU200_019822 [Digitaria exilis]
MADNVDVLVLEALAQRRLRPELMPKHVAIVMDGNRRWAEARGLTTPEGHEAGAQALKKIVELSCAWGIHAITAFAFSHENLNRPEATHRKSLSLSSSTRSSLNSLLFESAGGGRLLDGDDGADDPQLANCWFLNSVATAAATYMHTGKEFGCMSWVIPSRRPPSLQEAIWEAEETTRNNSRCLVVIATCYSGRWDIVQACRELAAKVQDKQLRPEDIDESMLAGHLATNNVLSWEINWPAPTCSSEQAASSGSAASCSGSAPTASSTSSTPCGPISGRMTTARR